MFRSGVGAYNQGQPEHHRTRRLNLVILDRDGVINHASPHHVRSAKEWLPIAGSLDAIARLGRAGCRVAIATRQPGIRRRRFTFEDLNLIHERMHRQLAEHGGAIDAIFVCLCLRGHACECFLPRLSILHAIADRMHVPLDGVPCIGAAPDMLAEALQAGARPIRVRNGAGGTTGPEQAGYDHGFPDGIEVHDDLASAADALLAAP